MKRLDWEEISKSEVLAEDFIQEHIQKLKLTNVLKYQVLSDNFIEIYKNHPQFSWYDLSENVYSTEEFLERYIDVLRWFYVTRSVPLREAFIKKHVKKIGWDNISMHQKLSLSFIRKNENKIGMEYLSCNKYLTEDVLEYYKNDLNWFDVSACTNLSFEIAKKYIQYIYVKELKSNECISFTDKQWKELATLRLNRNSK